MVLTRRIPGIRDALRRRWLQPAAVLAATVIVLASSCSGHFGSPIPEGIPPPLGDPVPDIDISARGRPADQLTAWATPRAAALGLPVAALEAYAYAAKVAQVVNPRCHIGWTTLAGIGTVESRNGTYRGARITPNGDVVPPIRGVKLDGTNGNLRIVEDAGTEDPEYAQAMGPMQFIPETWRLYGVDAHNDGVVNVDNIDDAALAAAGYLCYRGRDLAKPIGWMDAILAYNNSGLYLRTVRDWATAYAAGHAL
ncbi:lytic transglycosylase domain-containing protein [Mycobacterium sp. 141]|uniref:lytic transglycosylase domain-containing protein n=1 Tax=Mycobacterium sp. 141 TaxID=1120797 RepID=UPI0003808454|nr:lytic murein transglycosylase [Mycobacterium sp. 141]